jgi:hypothetical protein
MSIDNLIPNSDQIMNDFNFICNIVFWAEFYLKI